MLDLSVKLTKIIDIYKRISYLFSYFHISACDTVGMLVFNNKKSPERRITLLGIGNTNINIENRTKKENFIVFEDIFEGFFITIESPTSRCDVRFGG